MVKYLIFVSILLLFTGCDFSEPVKEFEGYFNSVESSNEIEVDCTSVAKRGDTGGTEEGYSCSVEITEDTIIRTEDGQKLSVEDLEKFENQYLDSRTSVKIVLSEERNINNSLSSRTGLEATEVIIFD